MAKKSSGRRSKKSAALLPRLFGYENLVGECGSCRASVIVNRATDLADASFAVGMSLPCPTCSAWLRISADTANHPIDHFSWIDFTDLYYQRKYMLCLLSLAQALEISLVITAHYVLVQLPVERSKRPAAGDSLEKLFLQKTQNMTLEPLKNLVAKLAVHRVKPRSLAEAIRVTSEINNLARDTPSAEVIGTIPGTAMREAIQKLVSTKIGSLRNNVAHRLGKRPTQQVVDAQRDEVRAVIKSLLTAFGLTPQGGQLLVPPPMA